MKKRPNPDSEPNIRRIDSKARASKQTHGFQVHVLRGSESITRMFSDSVYGGKESARRAARRFRREALAELPERTFGGLRSVKERQSSSSARGKAGKKTGRTGSSKAKSKRRG